MTRARIQAVLAAFALCGALPVPSGPDFAAALRAQDEFLDAELWIESGALVAADVATARERSKALWELARWTFSGMIWGFDFSYQPSDAARGVKEEFVVAPIAQLRWGDPRLRCLGAREDGGTSRARFEFALDAALASLRRGWFGGDTRPGTGSGYAARVNDVPFDSGLEWEGGFGELRVPRLDAIGAVFPEGAPASLGAAFEAKVEAIRIACREALRSVLRPEIRNKPKLVRGSFAFELPPAVMPRSAGYAATVRLRVIVREVVPYAVY